MSTLDAWRDARRRAFSVEQQRRWWRSFAERHELAFYLGPHRNYVQGDRIEGFLDGRAVRIQVDYDLQKLVVSIYIECNAAIVTPPSDPELAAWVSGRRSGIGAFLDRGELIYRQLYKIDEPTLEYLVAKLTAWAAQNDG